MRKPEELEIVCELFLDEQVTAKEVRAFEKKLKELAAEVFPKKRLRALWVHKGLEIHGSNTMTKRMRDQRIAFWFINSETVPVSTGAAVAAHELIREVRGEDEAEAWMAGGE